MYDVQIVKRFLSDLTELSRNNRVMNAIVKRKRNCTECVMIGKGILTTVLDSSAERTRRRGKDEVRYWRWLKMIRKKNVKEVRNRTETAQSETTVVYAIGRTSYDDDDDISICHCVYIR